MKIGPIELKNPTVFAPLAGISNLPMRLLAKSAGCALVYTEMISANGLLHGSTKTLQLLASTPQEKPLAVQLFGSDPGLLAEAARRVEAAGADMIDINFGCAVKKILKSGSGAALMRDLGHAEIILKSVRSAVGIPLTIKIRTGWEPSGAEALHLARIARDCGVDAIAVHPRTARQAFGGRADWSLIARIKAALDIPVIGNGDVTTAEDAARMLAATGCDAVMVGRAAIGNPFIFSQMIDRLAGRPVQNVAMADRFAVMSAYVDASIRHLGETTACHMLRSRLGWFAKGMPQAAQFRKTIRHISSRAQAEELLMAYHQSILQERAARRSAAYQA
ncbi:MAG: tRNA dihydrouridine synthase DusB [Desulfobacteraceae bacterium]|nr:MAG: tRNA dihydrouridine synthase DusB [Desulfobacteraceae bacterium]